MRQQYENLPDKLRQEGIEPTLPWLYGFKLDFRFRQSTRAAVTHSQIIYRSKISATGLLGITKEAGEIHVLLTRSLFDSRAIK